MGQTVYLAGPYAARDQLRRYAAELTSVGYKVGTRWLNEKHEISDETIGAATGLSDQQASAHAHDDLMDVDACDVFVAFTAAAVLTVNVMDAFTGAAGSSGGRHVETGYALAKQKPIVIVGEPENIFHRLKGGVTVVPDWHEAVLLLAQWLVQYHLAAPDAERAR